MNRTATRAERERFISLVLQHTPPKANGDSYALLRNLMSKAAMYGRIQEAYCNGPYTPPGMSQEWYNALQRDWSDVVLPKLERRESRLEVQINELAAKLGCTAVEFDGDPRGYTVKLRIPDSPFNDAEHLLGVPTS